MTLTEAIRSLREHSGQSQQIFATTLGMSIRGYARYEAGKTPEPTQIIALMTYAYYAKLEGPYRILYQALVEQLRPPPGFRVKITLEISKSEKK